ncbi:MAG: hypothetical protein BKP49_02835 [Treponema sp. CETP13]|nr:MAG: hypothetical protein BKP49_02835 [Treponema sp. CETP13]
MKRIHSLIIIFFALVGPIHAELLYNSTWNYTLDLPEGFELVATDGVDSFQYTHSFMPITTIIKSYSFDKYASSKETIQASFTQINATALSEIDSVDWQNQDCSIAMFSMQFEGVSYEGWAFSCSLPSKKGMVLLLTYATAEKADNCQQFLLSVLDSFYLGTENIKNPGAITSYAFPSTEDISYIVHIADKDIPVTMDKEAAMANEFVIEREYAILTLYSNSELWREAWQRYYRMIYRDSYLRLQQASFEIYSQLYPLAKEIDPEHTNRELAQILLTWTQGFSYEREKTNSDFANLPSIISGDGSDCDSRSMLLSVLLAHMNCQTMMFVSAEFSHALFGIATEGSKGKNAHIVVDGTSYLLGETTGHVDLGLIAVEMSDITKWISVLDF